MRGRGERGQTSVEWLGLMVLAVALLGALAATIGPVATALRAGVGKEICAVTGSGCGGSSGGSSSGGSSTDPDAPITAADPLPPGVVHLDPHKLGPVTADERVEPWTRFGMSEDDWHTIEDQVRDQVCEGGVVGFFTGCSFGGLTVNDDGQVVPIEIQEDGIGSVLGKLVKVVARSKPLPEFTAALRTAVKDLPLAVKNRLIAAGALKSPLEDLPKYAGGKTEGILDAGADETKLISGYNGPSKELPPGTRGFDNVFKSHVEGHAAATMRQTGATRATLYINQNPCRVCVARLPRALPEGYELRVVGPGGDVWIFKGLPGG